MQRILWILVVAGLLSACATPHPEQARSGPTEEIVQMIRKGEIKFHTGGILEQEVMDRSLVCDWVIQGRREAVEALLKATPLLRGESVVHRLPLLACVTNPEDYAYYKKLGARTHKYSDFYRYTPGYWPHATPLSEAAGNGNARAVSLLISDGVPVDEPGNKWLTPLGYALRIKEILQAKPQQFRPGQWNGIYFDTFHHMDGDAMMYGPKTLTDLEHVVTILLQSGANPEAPTMESRFHPSAAGETLYKRYAKDAYFRQAVGLARELQVQFDACRYRKSLTACQEISTRTDPLSVMGREASQIAAGLTQEQQEWGRLYASQKCRLQQANWLYEGDACVGSLAQGQGRARSRDGSLSFEGQFKRGQPVHGRLGVRGRPYFEGPMNNLAPEGAGICWHQGQPEECRMLNGERIDALHKQREENARQQSLAREQESREQEARFQRDMEEARRRRDREAEERRERRNERALAAGIASMRGDYSAAAAAGDPLASTLRMQQQQSQIMAQGMADLERTRVQREEARREQARRDAAQQDAEREARHQAQQRLVAQQGQQTQNAEVTRLQQQREAAALRVREEEARRQQEAQAASARREADRQQRERERQAQLQSEQQERAKLEGDYLRAIKDGTRMQAITCYGNHYVTGTRPRVKEPAHMGSCVDVAVTAWCPGDRVGRPVLASNFVGTGGCFGDIYKIEPKPSCEAEQMRVVVEEVRVCR